ncbi:ER membrane protein complex subunit 10 [Mortierella alpina]|uniref:ER membrane protein complex subunit 10 n=1 Tax=Mortierella alpina TaxID=64518 RepID=A0A9P6IX20_MORAP|nr:ER membrane protein complex subunit 10 [Mortierella alpina]
MRLNTYILALALVASTQVLAEEVTLGVWHKMSDSESFEKRGEIRLDAEEWLNHNQHRDQPLASSPQASKQKHQKQQQQSQQSQIVYQNAHLEPLKAQILAEDFILNVQAPIKAKEFEEEPAEPERDEDGNITETEEEFQQRLEEWKTQKEEHEAQDPALRTAGSYGFYQIKLRDESRNWEAMSSIKSCLLVASDFQEKITLHLDQNREVFAFDYYTSASECEEDHQKEFPLKTLDHFKNVSVDLVPSQSGPKARYARAQGIKMDETGNPAVEKTFFQKYWVYIVPIVLVMLLTGGEPEKTAA